VAKFYPNFPG